MPDEPHGITQPVQAAPEPTPPPPPPVEERADPPLEQAADGEGQDSQTLIDDAQMSLWGDQPAQDGQEEAQSAVEGAPTLWDETSIPDEGGQGTAAVAGAPPPTEVDEMIQAAAGVQVAAPKDETPPTATWPVGTADDAEDAAPAPVGYEERYTGQSDGATEETVETAPEETEPPLEPAPLDSVPPVTPVFDDTVRPGQRAGVRPPEQNRDFTTDGHEGEVQPVAPVPLRDAGARRKPTLEQAEKRMDELLAKAVDIEGTVAVMSPAGGVGKSTMSLAIADTLAKAGVGPIAIVDCDPEYNGLALLGVGQLNKLYTEAPARPEGYAIHLPSGAHLYAMPMEPELQRFFAENPATLRHTATLLRDTYKVVILDAGAGVNNPIGRELGATCNEAVLVSRASFSTSAGMLAAYGYLRNARGMVDPGGEATRTTVTTVINNIRDYHRPYLGIIQEEYFAAYIQPLLVPSSEAIEFGLEAGTFNQADMPVAVRVALKRVAATVAAGLRRT